MEPKTRAEDYPFWVSWCLIAPMTWIHQVDSAPKTHLELLYGVVAGLSGINLLEAPIPSYYTIKNGLLTGLLTELINVLAMGWMARCANGVPRDDEQSMIMAHVWWSSSLILLIEIILPKMTTCSSFHVGCSILHYTTTCIIEKSFPRYNLYSANTTITVLHH